jgi:diguanylate cyclase (GGDEF)-like protein
LDCALISQRRSILALFFLALAAAVPAQPPPDQDQPSRNTQPQPLRTLTTLRQAHELSADEARRGYPVHVRAVVTYFDPGLDWRHIAFFLHDATDGIFAAAPHSTIWSRRQPLPGTLVDVTGVTGIGDYSPFIDQAHVTVIGNSRLPVYAKPVTLAHLLTGVEDRQWVATEGIVHSVSESATNVTLHIGVNGGVIGATTVKRPGVDYQHLVDASIHIRGVAAPTFNSNRQMTGVRLFFPSLETVTAVAPGPGSVFDRPVQPLSGLLRFSPNLLWNHRVHVRGVVTLDWPGRTVCIEDSTGGVCAQTTQTSPLAVGSLTNLAGFAALAGFKPTLTDASFRPAASGAVPAPVAVTSSQALQGNFDSQRVQIDGRLISRDGDGGYTNLLLSDNNLVYRVLIPVELAGSRLATIPVGSTLRVTGICSVQVDPERTLRGYGATQASSFWILLASPHDVVVLQTPSWWTVGRIEFLLLFTLAVTVAGFVWVVVLRRRVEQQTRELRQGQERYRHRAHHDALTGLPTRALLHDRLQTALDRSRRYQKGVALLMLDLDKFKQINDSLGHSGGDRVLCVTAERIVATVRKTDSVARMGGDEFVVLLTDLSSPDQAECIAAKIVAALSVPIRINKLEVPVSVSVGVCTLSDGDSDAEVLLKRVDAAMYRAKARGRSCFQVFTSDMIGHSRNQLQLYAALGHALEHQEFELYYQPLMDCATGELTGFEALLRWNSREFGRVLPGDFITLAEESGLIIPIGEWVLREACRQIRLLERTLQRSFNLSVNLSPLQLLQDDLTEVVARSLAKNDRSPASLSLEITESNLISDSRETRELLNRIRATGVQLVLDDFGIGFSTLSYITQFPLDWIKVDQSLVRNCTTDRGSVAVIRAIVEMAHGLGIRVVAEGVESCEQASLLRDEGCDAAQGFYISHPVPAAELPGLVAALDQSSGAHFLAAAVSVD